MLETKSLLPVVHIYRLRGPSIRLNFSTTRDALISCAQPSKEEKEVQE